MVWSLPVELLVHVLFVLIQVKELRERMRYAFAGIEDEDMPSGIAGNLVPCAFEDALIRIRIDRQCAIVSPVSAQKARDDVLLAFLDRFGDRARLGLYVFALRVCLQRIDVM